SSQARQSTVRRHSQFRGSSRMVRADRPWPQMDHNWIKRGLTMMLEETLAEQLGNIVKQHIAQQVTPLRDQLDALSARVNGLEGANTVRASVDELKARMDRVEQASKAAVVRLPRSGAA